MSHIEILTAITQTYDKPIYLEIGLGDGGCFERVATYARCAHGVDPEIKFDCENTKAIIHQSTSDDFFAAYSDLRFDLIFIDGDHYEEQVWRDFQNSVKCLSERGVIALHDGWPETSAQAVNGCDTAYRTIERIEKIVSYDCFTLPIFPGLTLVRPRRKRFA